MFCAIKRQTGLQTFFSNCGAYSSCSNNVKMQVKTYATEGMIWMVGSTKDSPDYSVLYLDKGKVIYKCNLGTYIMDTFVYIIMTYM